MTELSMEERNGFLGIFEYIAENLKNTFSDQKHDEKSEALAPMLKWKKSSDFYSLLSESNDAE